MREKGESEGSQSKGQHERERGLPGWAGMPGSDRSGARGRVMVAEGVAPVCQGDSLWELQEESGKATWPKGSLAISFNRQSSNSFLWSSERTDAGLESHLSYLECHPVGCRELGLSHS
jgi:hypothetical protein